MSEKLAEFEETLASEEKLVSKMLEAITEKDGVVGEFLRLEWMKESHYLSSEECMKLILSIYSRLVLGV